MATLTQQINILEAQITGWQNAVSGLSHDIANSTTNKNAYCANKSPCGPEWYHPNCYTTTHNISDAQDPSGCTQATAELATYTGESSTLPKQIADAQTQLTKLKIARVALWGTITLIVLGILFVVARHYGWIGKK